MGQAMSSGSSPDEEMFPYEQVTDFADRMPEGFVMRPLQSSDYDKGFLELLSQLTTVGDVSREKFEAQFHSMKHTDPQTYFIVVIEELSIGKVVATGMLVLESHFIHECGSRGRIEDVVVDAKQRGRQFGKLVNECLVELARKKGVYKLSLECKDRLISFYEQFGYEKAEDNNFLVQRFDH